MYKYRNKRTGVEFVTPCVCSGEMWEPVKAPASRKKNDTEKEEEGKKK